MTSIKKDREMNEDRIAREKAYHEMRFDSENSERRDQEKFYSVTRYAKDKYRDLISRAADQGEILEYGCGEKISIIENKVNYKKYIAIDISEVAVRKCKKNYQNIENVEFKAMNAEKLDFSDNSIDLIFGSGIIHHLDIDLSMREINRVLKKGGAGIFFEPMGHNPLINLYRKKTPNARSKDEHPLLMEDLKKIANNFEIVNLHFYVLFSLVLFPLRNKRYFTRIYKKISEFEDYIVKKFPILQKYCWIVVIDIKK